MPRQNPFYIKTIWGNTSTSTLAETHRNILDNKYDENDLLKILLKLKEENPSAKQSNLIIQAKKMAYQKKIKAIDLSLSQGEDNDSGKDFMCTGSETSEPVEDHKGNIHLAYLHQHK